jgi:hypothetical protein
MFMNDLYSRRKVLQLGMGSAAFAVGAQQVAAANNPLSVQQGGKTHDTIK